MHTQMRQTVRRAYALATLLGHSAVGTTHLLIAEAMSEHPAFLRQCLTAQELLAQLLSLRGRGHALEQLPRGLTKHAKAALQAPEPLLTALLRGHRSGALRLLECCHADIPLLFTQSTQFRKEQAMQTTRLLDQFGVGLVERADLTQTVIGRQREIEAVLQILCRKHKHNPALIGEPGVGKTAIVEGVAQYIAAGRVPEQLRGKRLIALDMASVLAGTKYRGEFEERVRDILNEIRRAQNIILFVDEMHTLVGAGAAEGAIDAANLLKPALGRAEIQLIGATTLAEYRKHIEKDAALERRFRCVQIREPSREETTDILRGLRMGLEAHHHIAISEEAILAAVELSCRYLSDKFLPDKAVDLLDEGAARAKLAQTNGLQDCEALTKAVQSGHFELAATLREKLQRGRTAARPVNAQDIAAAVSGRTGIPTGVISVTERQRLRDLEQTLARRVVGQSAAIRATAEAVRRGRSGLAEGKRPIAAMLFTGPTGVGKTELCKALAEAVYGSEQAMIRVDMSEYMEKFSVSRLIGAPPGYVGHDEGGELCERVRRRPYSLVLLDELEKAHRDVCGILLQVMEDGVLTDSGGRTVDFRNTLLVMTSNLGSHRAGCGALGFDAQAQDATMQALREQFPPEFLGRIDCIAPFSPLGETELVHIAKLQLQALRQRAAKQNLELNLTDALANTLGKRALHSKSGAREVRRLIQSELEAPLADKLLADTPSHRITATIENNTIVLH